MPTPSHWCCPDTESTIFTQTLCKLPSLPETLRAHLLCAGTDQRLNTPVKLYILHGPVWHVSHSGSKVTGIFSHPGSLKYHPWWKEVLSAQWPALNSPHSPVKCITHSHSLCQTLKDAYWGRKASKKIQRDYYWLNTVYTVAWGCTATLRCNKSLSSSSPGQIWVITQKEITTGNTNYPAWSRTCVGSQTTEV